jgi:competence protein ComFC
MKINILDNIFSGLSDLFYPRLCQTCNRSLHAGETIICLHCNLNLPRTHFHSNADNKAAQIFFGRLKIAHASSFLYFTKDGMTQQLLHRFKYNGKLAVGKKLGSLFAAELKDCEWIKDVDFIIPVPLHKKKEKLRGFNQAVILAQSLGDALSIPVKTDGLIRVTNTISQTRKSRHARLENVANAFIAPHLEALEHKHVLLIDDVLTTGATLEACAMALLRAKGIKVSIVSIALATH